MPHRKSAPTISRMIAARHEALWLKLTALHNQVVAVATKRPQAPVSENTARIAEALLLKALLFMRRGERLPIAAPDHGGLLTLLGQALAEMDYWEASHSRWDAGCNAYLWQVAGAVPLPVQRLRPKLITPAHFESDPARAAKMLDLRQKLAKRIEQFNNR